jgi:choline dehydrogenase-like flavoprotein
VIRLQFEGDRAVGAEALIDGVPQSLRAEREVILCAGAYNSPQLLMLSGIGPAEHLVEHGLDVRLDLPTVGANLSDHVNAGVIFRTDTETLMTAESEANVALLQTEGRGPLTSNVAEAGGFWRSRDGLAAPDVQFHMAPVMFTEEGLVPPSEHAWSAGACVLTPEGRGEVRLRSADPAAKPRILTRWLDGERDWATMLAAQRLLLDIARRDPIARHGTTPFKAPASNSDADLRAHVREVAHCLYHPVGTCAIGSVVDAELRVRGVDGLRVADASVMPAVPRGNTNAPAIMVGERAADLLLGTPSAPAAGAIAAASGSA